MARDEMNQLPADFTLPDTTNSPECAEFLRTGDESWANQRVAAVEATDAVSHTVYVQLITPVAGAEFSLASAIIEVDGHLVQFVGIGPELADAEFVRLANAAADRVRDTL
jgi:hypothetical protein